MRNATTALFERLEKLKHFNKCYDEGQESFAIDIATTIRTICKDNKNTQSLLSLAGLKSQIIFCMHSDIRINEEIFTPSHILCLLNMSGQKSSYKPLLDDIKEVGGKTYHVKFNQWWDQYVIKDSSRNKFSRKDLIETVCDKEGGAHFDPKLDQKSHDLFYKNSIGWTISLSNQATKPLDNKVHLASIRHIGYELVNALDEICSKNN